MRITGGTPARPRQFPCQRSQGILPSALWRDNLRRSPTGGDAMRKTLAMLMGTLALGFAGATQRGDPWTRDFALDPDELVSAGRNPYFILEPGFTSVLEDSDERLVITVLDETRTVGGIETRAVEERENKNAGLVEASRNYYAISRATNP